MRSRGVRCAEKKREKMMDPPRTCTYQHACKSPKRKSITGPAHDREGGVKPSPQTPKREREREREKTANVYSDEVCRRCGVKLENWKIGKLGLERPRLEKGRSFPRLGSKRRTQPTAMRDREGGRTAGGLEHEVGAYTMTSRKITE